MVFSIPSHASCIWDWVLSLYLTFFRGSHLDVPLPYILLHPYATFIVGDHHLMVYYFLFLSILRPVSIMVTRQTRNHIAKGKQKQLQPEASLRKRGRKTRQEVLHNLSAHYDMGNSSMVRQ